MSVAASLLNQMNVAVSAIPDLWDAVIAIDTFLVAVVPTTMGLPPFTTTLLITGSAAAAFDAASPLAFGAAARSCAGKPKDVIAGRSSWD
ncbi:hypothetical protein [Streptomyces sp. NPDC056641]|uniref:hypothetical protein n=1 Tax=unclassified Streptomyces TaxID=2593676 RepID=UPI00369BFDDD